MAIKLKTLERLAKTYTEQKYLYKDLAFDLTKSELLAPGFNVPVPQSDIKASFDAAAIRNSLQNLFNTRPGQRFLFPEYGLDLHQFLFLPVTDAVASAIRDVMVRGIQRFEPRVTVQNIIVVPDSDSSTFNITIILVLPAFRNSISLQGELNIKNQSFIFLPSTRNA